VLPAREYSTAHGKRRRGERRSLRVDDVAAVPLPAIASIKFNVTTARRSSSPRRATATSGYLRDGSIVVGGFPARTNPSSDGLERGHVENIAGSIGRASGSPTTARNRRERHRRLDGSVKGRSTRRRLDFAPPVPGTTRAPRTANGLRRCRGHLGRRLDRRRALVRRRLLPGRTPAFKWTAAAEA